MPEAPTEPKPEPELLLAAAVCDPWGELFRPGALAVRGGEVAAWGPADDLERTWAGARRVDLGPVVVLPGMVNAHAHLDLAGRGPRPYGGDFLGWVRAEVLPMRRAAPGPALAAVRAAAAASLAAGVEAIGDVAGVPGARAALRGTGLRGVSYEEVFGLRPAAVERLAGRAAEVAAEGEAGGVAPGLQPHAPYSVSPAGYAACVGTGLRLSTHLAELAEEAELVARGTGPMRAMLGEAGLWGPELEEAYGGGRSPVAWLAPSLAAAAGRFVVAHANHVSDEDIATLAATGTSVAYCPVASAYFGHRGHRHRELLDAGVNVALGTDSVLCQPPDEPQPHGILPQVRTLLRRDGTEPATLVRMACANGFAALGLPVRTTRLLLLPVDADAGDPLRRALAGGAPPRTVALGPV
ncbi:amidohydrolase family protein [Phycisphaera mikurensis]|uniref:Putative hydrolase n=1 Tax=Phycisphaera mikurensis (strain NBRC 102666 / KCTC 22515 / FYK2301M01) TaxID=1142394 RepID=I0IAW6_PHYMF|nr:amidohydrolase family protein [Phycisphaera mikurensis]MBB6442622.1 cytosine/adenosine deaminase-related metal-dependent hydrolase [Phycisphaera mikurensis]BAM02404.1 putative hydrolase [Phycisphaera mikurensis NBRC 102666]